MPLYLFYTMVQKSQKRPKTQIKGVLPKLQNAIFYTFHYSTNGSCYSRQTEPVDEINSSSPRIGTKCWKFGQRTCSGRCREEFGTGVLICYMHGAPIVREPRLAVEKCWKLCHLDSVTWHILEFGNAQRAGKRCVFFICQVILHFSKPSNFGKMSIFRKGIFYHSI